MKILGRLFLAGFVLACGWMGYRYAAQVVDWDYGFFADSAVPLPRPFGQREPDPAPEPSGTSPSGPSTIPMVPCPACKATGSVACAASRCDHGRIPCPGPCLKLSVGKWEKMDVPGHGPNELWQKFTNGNGWHAWTTAHVGEVIQEKNGKFINTGKCPVCKGKSTIACPVCQGTGKIICKNCGGQRKVPAHGEEKPPLAPEIAPATPPAPEPSSQESANSLRRY